MHQRSIFAKGLLAATAAASVFTMAAPQIAAAQPYGDNGYYDDRYQDCRQQQGDHTVAGAVIGGLAGAAIGGGVTGRGSGALVGGAIGAAGGAAVGNATTDCQPVYDQGPPPPGYDDRYGDRYDDRYGRPECTMAEDRIVFPDGSDQRSQVRVCRDPGGRWYVAQ